MLHDFAADKIIFAEAINIEQLIKMVKEESEIAIDWFKANGMIVNPDKFQATEIKINRHMLNSYPLNKMDENINPEAGVKLFGIDTNDKLTFDNDTSTF